MSNIVFRHYGDTEFSADKFTPATNRPTPWVKPLGGLWASPEGEDFDTWKEWCESEDFCECDEANSFCFTLKPEANIFTLRSSEDVNRLFALCGIPQGALEFITKLYAFDFEKLQEKGYDGLMTLISEDHELYYLMYGWDCDSIVIFNPEMVVPL